MSVVHCSALSCRLSPTRLRFPASTLLLPAGPGPARSSPATPATPAGPVLGPTVWLPLRWPAVLAGNHQGRTPGLPSLCLPGAVCARSVAVVRQMMELRCWGVRQPLPVHRSAVGRLLTGRYGPYRPYRSDPAPRADPQVTPSLPVAAPATPGTDGDCHHAPGGRPTDPPSSPARAGLPLPWAPHRRAPRQAPRPRAPPPPRGAPASRRAAPPPPRSVPTGGRRAASYQHRPTAPRRPPGSGRSPCRTGQSLARQPLATVRRQPLTGWHPHRRATVTHRPAGDHDPGPRAAGTRSEPWRLPCAGAATAHVTGQPAGVRRPPREAAGPAVVARSPT